MYGVYSWNAGAVAAQVQADLVALIAGAAVGDLSASCNKAASSRAGGASGWSVVDAGYGVVSMPGQAGGPGAFGRVTVSAAPRIQLAAVDAWNMGTHAAGFQTTAIDCSQSLSVAGSVTVLASAAGLLLAASDWGFWAFVGEVKRDGQSLVGDALAPGSIIVNVNGQCYMPRLKSPSAVGDLSGPSVTFASSFGTLSASASRNRAESLYIPMVPAVVAYSSVPVGEVAGLMIAGGYGQSGDFMLDSSGGDFLIAKFSNTLCAVPRV
ncbi:hypothetical protein [Dechloromonas sp. A34]|uniref:hypothetical protein n=1 Tax=Dechloromonas sp. A34 TaxID=447588 RepID=UPI002248851A|nr:hypothetical protein [Dechloromonas sp. A34]